MFQIVLNGTIITFMTLELVYVLFTTLEQVLVRCSVLLVCSVNRFELVHGLQVLFMNCTIKCLLSLPVSELCHDWLRICLYRFTYMRVVAYTLV